MASGGNPLPCVRPLTLQHRRLALQKDDPATAKKPKRYFLQPLWLLGILAMLAGALLSFAVFNFLGQSRASAMAAITIFWNGIMSAVFLGERFTAWDGIVSGIIIGGACVAVVFGSVGAGSQPTDSLATVVQMLSRQIVWIAAILVIALFASLYAAVRVIARKGKSRTPQQVRVECYCRITLSALLTGVTGMLASAVVKSIGGAVKAEDAVSVIGAWQFYLMLLSLPVSLVGQLGFLNSALCQLDALVIVPPYQSGVIIVGLIWGMVFTGDASGATDQSVALFVIGCAISCCGVLLLGLKRRMVPLLDVLWVRLGWARCLPRNAETHAAEAALGPALAQQREAATEGSPVVVEERLPATAHAAPVAEPGAAAIEARPPTGLADSDAPPILRSESGDPGAAGGAGAMPMPPQAHLLPRVVTRADSLRGSGDAVCSAGAGGAQAGALGRPRSMRPRLSSWQLVSKAVFAHPTADEIPEHAGGEAASESADATRIAHSGSLGSTRSAKVSPATSASVVSQLSARKRGSSSECQAGPPRWPRSDTAPEGSHSATSDDSAIQVMESLPAARVAALLASGEAGAEPAAASRERFDTGGSGATIVHPPQPQGGVLRSHSQRSAQRSKPGPRRMTVDNHEELLTSDASAAVDPSFNLMSSLSHLVLSVFQAAEADGAAEHPEGEADAGNDEEDATAPLTPALTAQLHSPGSSPQHTPLQLGAVAGSDGRFTRDSPVGGVPGPLALAPAAGSLPLVAKSGSVKPPAPPLRPPPAGCGAADNALSTIREGDCEEDETHSVTPARMAALSTVSMRRVASTSGVQGVSRGMGSWGAVAEPSPQCSECTAGLRDARAVPSDSSNSLSDGLAEGEEEDYGHVRQVLSREEDVVSGVQLTARLESEGIEQARTQARPH